MPAADHPVAPPPGALLLLEGRALLELGAYGASLPWLRTAPRGDGHPVMVLPGLSASDLSTRPMRSFLIELGYAAHGWGLGRNVGGRGVIDQFLVPRLAELHRRHGRKLSLVGWSLGGILARELAKRSADHVRSVITLGSPFAGGPGATNVGRLFETLSGRRLHDDPWIRRRLAEPPPVPTTSIFSRSDGVVAWQACVQSPAPFTENIEVRGSHCGLGHHPAALYAVADRLAQPEGRWQPFRRSGLRAAVYPDPQR